MTMYTSQEGTHMSRCCSIDNQHITEAAHIVPVLPFLLDIEQRIDVFAAS